MKMLNTTVIWWVTFRRQFQLPVRSGTRVDGYIYTRAGIMMLKRLCQAKNHPFLFCLLMFIICELFHRQNCSSLNFDYCGNVASVPKTPFMSYSCISYFGHACLKLRLTLLWTYQGAKIKMLISAWLCTFNYITSKQTHKFTVQNHVAHGIFIPYLDKCNIHFSLAIQKRSLFK